MVSILDNRAGYYTILEQTQKANMDVTPWLMWFLQTLLAAIAEAIRNIDRVSGKARFWQAHRVLPWSKEQLKVINRLLDGGAKGFEGSISAAQYQAVAKVSKAATTRHLADLLERAAATVARWG